MVSIGPGTVVRWRSQANGSWKEKEGVVLAHLPRGVDAREVLAALGVKDKLVAQPVSTIDRYLVRVRVGRTAARVYAPPERVVERGGCALTFAEEIEKMAGSEPIVACVIGQFGWDGLGADGRDIPPEKRNVVLSWDEARSLLNYPCSHGYGTPDCHAVYVWTPTRVIFVWQYDGSTGLAAIPRNPTPCEPEMPGG